MSAGSHAAMQPRNKARSPEKNAGDSWNLLRIAILASSMNALESIPAEGEALLG
jgi:hypothetical protein